VFYIGINRKLTAINHHTLFFDESLHRHSIEIYKKQQYPSQPLFYMCCPSKTDTSVAPKGCENIFLLMPIAPGLPDNEQSREKYFDIMLDRIEKNLGESLRENIIYKKSYCINDFVNDYNSYKGQRLRFGKYADANSYTETKNQKPKNQKNDLRRATYRSGSRVCHQQLFQGKLQPDYFKKN
jgi:phytoene desaturase